jgi:RND family efflux transporter MFP subunit
VRDDELNLQNAQLSLQKLQLQDSDPNLNTTLASAYDNAFNTVSNTYLDLPNVMNGLTSMFFQAAPKTGYFYIDWYAQQVGSDYETETQANTYKQALTDSYNLALAAYNASSANFETVSRSSDDATISNLISDTYNTTKLMANMITDATNYINFVDTSMQYYGYTIPASIGTQTATLNTYTSELNTDLANSLSSQTTIQNDTQAFPSDNIDVQTAQLNVTQQQNALSDAKQALSNYYITAPFSGIMATVPVLVGDNAGSGTVLGTIITNTKIATISLNEIDVAKIALGQQATLTFDAAPNLTITGKVIEIDSVGTVSSGVVNYNVEISFDTNDSRIKPGMSVDAEIITDVKQGILTIPSSAIKTQGSTSYVQMFSSPLPPPLAGVQGSVSLIPPVNQVIQTGISDDTSTEVVSGLNAGDQIVTKTITTSAPTTTATTTPSLLSAVGGGGRGGLGGGGGGAFRGATTSGR